MAVLLALDFGTEGVRVAAYDSDGRPLAAASSAYSTTFPGQGRAEQDPEEWWRATCQATRAVLSDPAAAGDVVGLGIATTASTVVFLGADGRPLRPALLWMDARASDEAALTATLSESHPVLAYSGGSDAVEWLVPKAMWVARHEPETWAATSRVVECLDYLSWRLTGQWTGSIMNAVCKANYDATTASFPDDLYAALGIPDLRSKLPETIATVGSAIGPLTDTAAEALGLRGRPVVAVGGIDAHVSLVACGSAEAGTVSVVAGTSTAFVTEAEQPVWSETIWGPYPDALTPGRWLVEGGQVSSGSVLSWTSRDLLGVARDDLATLGFEAAAVAPDSHGLVALDNFMGNRTPLRDPRLRGAFVGMSLGTTRAEIYRSAVEAVAYGTRTVLESFADLGLVGDRVVLSGGIRHNPLWLATTCDVLGRPLEVVESDNLTLRACAAFAATAAGLYPDLPSAAATYRPVLRTLEPDLSASQAYDVGYERYRRVNDTLRPVFHELTREEGPR